MIQIRTAAFLLGGCSAICLGCSTRVETASVATSPPVTERTAPSQATLDREEERTRAESASSSTILIADPSASALAEVDAKQAAHLQAVELAMEYCRPQAELASHYFDETARAIYIDAIDARRRLSEKRIKADVTAVIEGGTRVLIKAGSQDRGIRKLGRDRSFRSYVRRYEEHRSNGLSHEETLSVLEELAAH